MVTMEAGQADEVKIELDRHSDPRTVRVVKAYIDSEELLVEFPDTSPGSLFTDLRERVDLDDVVEVL